MQDLLIKWPLGLPIQCLTRRLKDQPNNWLLMKCYHCFVCQRNSCQILVQISGLCCAVNYWKSTSPTQLNKWINALVHIQWGYQNPYFSIAGLLLIVWTMLGIKSIISLVKHINFPYTASSLHFLYQHQRKVSLPPQSHILNGIPANTYVIICCTIQQLQRSILISPILTCIHVAVPVANYGNKEYIC